MKTEVQSTEEKILVQAASFAGWAKIPKDEFAEFLLDFWESYQEWLGEERLILEYDSEPWDCSGCTTKIWDEEKEDYVKNEGTTKDYLDAFSGSWQATFESGRGKDHLTYRADWRDHVVDFMEPFSEHDEDGFLEYDLNVCDELMDLLESLSDEVEL